MILYRLNLNLERMWATIIRLIQVYANNTVSALNNKALFI